MTALPYELQVLLNASEIEEFTNAVKTVQAFGFKVINGESLGRLQGRHDIAVNEVVGFRKDITYGDAVMRQLARSMADLIIQDGFAKFSEEVNGAEQGTFYRSNTLSIRAEAHVIKPGGLIVDIPTLGLRR